MNFLEWSEKQLDDPWTYNLLFRKAISRIGKLRKQNPEKVKKMIVEKLEKARQEYGEPQDNKYDFEKELNEEIIDLVFGWVLVQDYLQEVKAH